MKRVIEISSIFEGFMPSALYGSEGQYLQAIGIDPDVPLTDSASDIKTGGSIRPVQYAQFSGAEIDAAPIAIITEPKSDMTWVVLANGKVVAYEDDLTSLNSHSIGQVSGNKAQGAWYYNNYIYITTATDVSRVGPLNTLPFDGQTGNFTTGSTITGGTSGATAVIVSQVDAGATGTLTLDQISGIFLNNETITDAVSGSATVNRTFASLITNNVWTGATLGSQTALTDTNYPTTLFEIGYLNHFGFAHNNGVSYVLDFKDGLGYIHKIQTTKTTNQGDTNDGSAYGSVGSLSLPFDYIPITASSYGVDVVISGTKTSDVTVNQGNASLFFWDAAEELFYRVVQLPDPICPVLKYVNGTLYGLSGSLSGGYRLWRYVGGDTIETLKIIEDGYPPLQMASDFVGNRLVWGANTTLPIVSSGLYAYGSKSDLFPRGLHHIAVSGFTTPVPSASQSLSPSASPSQSPSRSLSPSLSPSKSPSKSPSLSPSLSPSISPSVSPS